MNNANNVTTVYPLYSLTRPNRIHGFRISTNAHDMASQGLIHEWQRRPDGSVSPFAVMAVEEALNASVTQE